VDLNEFIDRGRVRWQRFSKLLDRIEKEGLKSLTLDEAREFGRLYRAASSDLLWARGRSASAELVESLNDLVARGYAQTYPGQRPRLRDAGTYFLTGFPKLVRVEWKAVVAAYSLFLAGMAFGYAAMHLDPGAAIYLVPEEHQELDPDKRVSEEARKDHGASANEQTAFASFLFTHNIQVAFLAFALGLTLGIGTAILLFTNGLFLGALAVAYENKGHAVWFWAWILPHGVPEISAICFAGAAGLILGRALVAPGSRSRTDAMRVEGRTAVRLVLGTIPVFIVAGMIEGTISQIHPPQLPAAFKLTFAAAMAVLLLLYLSRAGKSEEPEPPGLTEGHAA
jgi:uncharacterized membrane protein SpoIIM required for sporulation